MAERRIDVPAPICTSMTEPGLPLHHRLGDAYTMRDEIRRRRTRQRPNNGRLRERTIATAPSIPRHHFIADRTKPPHYRPLRNCMQRSDTRRALTSWYLVYDVSRWDLILTWTTDVQMGQDPQQSPSWKPGRQRSLPRSPLAVAPTGLYRAHPRKPPYLCKVRRRRDSQSPVVAG